jgi:hypothetical protein
MRKLDFGDTLVIPYCSITLNNSKRWRPIIILVHENGHKDQLAMELLISEQDTCRPLSPRLLTGRRALDHWALDLYSGSQRSNLQGFEPLQRSCRLDVNPSTKGRRNLLGVELRIQEDPDLRDPSSHTNFTSSIRTLSTRINCQRESLQGSLFRLLSLRDWLFTWNYRIYDRLPCKFRLNFPVKYLDTQGYFRQ